MDYVFSSQRLMTRVIRWCLPLLALSLLLLSLLALLLLLVFHPWPLQAGMGQAGLGTEPAAQIDIIGTGKTSPPGNTSPPSSSKSRQVDSPFDPTVQLHIRVGELEMEIAQLRGSIEEILFRLDRLEAMKKTTLNPAMSDQKKHTGENTGGSLGASRDRLRDGLRGWEPSTNPDSNTIIGDPPALSSTTMNQQTMQEPDEDSSPAAQEILLVGDTPRKRYEYALSLLLGKDYKRAERSLRAFVEAHDDDPLANNAHYWIAETYYVRKKYAKAATLFAKAYKRDPKGSKAADNLLKLAFSLEGMQDTEQSCSVLGEIEKKFPNADKKILMRAKHRHQELVCPK